MAKYQIKINEPCNENWDKMSPREKGRFCNNCKKTVVDYTNTSDLELARLIHKGENICGRFKKTQLSKDLDISQKSYLPKLSYTLSLISFLGFSSPILSQTKVNEEISVNWSQTKSGKDGKSKIKKRFFKGNISDKTGPLPGASILIKGTKTGVETDFDGNFELAIDKSYLKKNNITIIITYLGYKSKSFVITKKNFRKKIKIFLEEDNNVLGGYGIIEKRNIFEEILHYTKRVFTK